MAAVSRTATPEEAARFGVLPTRPPFPRYLATLGMVAVWEWEERWLGYPRPRAAEPAPASVMEIVVPKVAPRAGSSPSVLHSGAPTPLPEKAIRAAMREEVERAFAANAQPQTRQKTSRVPPPEDDDLYPVRRAAQKAGVCERTVRDAIKSEELTASKKGSRWYVARENLRRWMISAGNSSASSVGLTRSVPPDFEALAEAALAGGRVGRARHVVAEGRQRRTYA